MENLVENLVDKINENKIIHCIDCKYLGLKDFVFGYCKHEKGMCGLIKPNDYCSRGETKHET